MTYKALAMPLPAHDLTSAPAETDAEPAFDRQRFFLAVGAGVVALCLAAGFFWLRYGGLIFFDMLAALRGCF